VFYGVRDYAPSFPPVLEAESLSRPGSEAESSRPIPTPAASRTVGFDRGGVLPTHPCRVFFPSLDGTPDSAPILTGCGRYPMILFAHGQCGEADHYRKWYELPAQLARCGYVVVVPELPEIASGTLPSDANADLALIGQFLNWIRTGWEFRATVLPSATGLVAHSRGGGLAARYVSEVGGIAAFASLSGHGLVGNTNFGIPKLLTWGVNGPDTSSLTASDWQALPRPKHRAEFDGIGHFDYLPAGRSTCDQPRGSCSSTPGLSWELVSMFFGRYLQPEGAPDLKGTIPSSLLPPKLSDLGLTQDQQFYAGGWLSAFANISSHPGCKVSLTWELSAADTGTLSMP
jgi:Chlorophyllase enzyme